MKTITLTLLTLVLLTSCGEPSKISEIPVIEQVELLDSPNTYAKRYAVKLKTSTAEKQTFMYTNFKYEVGDTLVSFNTYVRYKTKPADSLKIYQDRYRELKQENDALKNYVKFLEKKIIKSYTE